jgi:hypothetical protein
MNGYSNRHKPIDIPALTWILRGFAILLVALMLINIWGTWRRTETVESAIDVIALPAKGENDLRIQAHLDRNRLGLRRPTGCWFIVQNNGNVPFLNVSMTNWSAPGFRPPTFVSSVIKDLAPHQSATFRPQPSLVTIDSPIHFMTTAEFSWSVGDEMRHKIVSLGPVSVEGDAEPRLYTVTRAALGYLKDLALPLVLVLFGELYRKRSQAEAEQQHERELDRASWNLMLPKIHENNERYNLPFGNAAALAAAKFPTADPADPESFDETTLNVLLFRKHARTLYERIGGYYFRTREAEELVTKAEWAFVEALKKHVPAVVISEAMSKTGRFALLHVFKQTTLSEPTVHAVRQALITWKSTDPEGASAAFTALKILATVLFYDINLIYRFWYEEPPSPLDSMAAETKQMRAVAPFKAVADLYDGYVKLAQGRAW